MKQGKLVLGEVTFPEDTSCILQKELSSLLFSSVADTSFLCNVFSIKNLKGFFARLGFVRLFFLTTEKYAIHLILQIGMAKQKEVKQKG